MTDFAHIPPGLGPELAHLGLDEVVEHLASHLTNLVLEPAACTRYSNRLATDPGIGAHPEALAWLRYLAGKYVQLEPLDEAGLHLAAMLDDDPALKSRLQVLRGMDPDPAQTEAVFHLLMQHRDDEAENALRRMLKRVPGHLRAADQLLRLQVRREGRIGEWIEEVRCPASLARAWRTRLLLAAASVNDVETALRLLDTLEPENLSESVHNAAAECRARAGHTRRALDHYARSLALDPRQDPIRRRMEELKNPFAPDTSLALEKNVHICLYSWNKAQMLEKTLAALHASDIGPASITVLLNGCTDGSRAVADNARALFLDNRFHIEELPVNIGAPAARNWLIASEEAQGADYVAFLDDDVDLPRDWLHHFLTVAEKADNPGVVGCKVVSPGALPGAPARYQYLYRNLTVVRRDMLRLSHPNASGVYDTGRYDFVREADNVMGCCHLLSRGLLDALPEFDLRYSPSQMDDIAHDLEARLAGFTVHYTGLVTCVHHQRSGCNDARADLAANGNVLGNDVKFFHAFASRLDALAALKRRPAPAPGPVRAPAPPHAARVGQAVHGAERA